MLLFPISSEHYFWKYINKLHFLLSRALCSRYILIHGKWSFNRGQVQCHDENYCKYSDVWPKNIFSLFLSSLVKRVMLIFPLQVNRKKSFNFWCSCMLQWKHLKDFAEGHIVWINRPHCWMTAVQSYINYIRSKHWTHGGAGSRGKESLKFLLFSPKQIWACVWICLTLGLLVAPNANSLGWYHGSISCSHFHKMLSNLGEKGRNCKKNVKTSA